MTAKETDTAEKPLRQYFHTYVQLIRNSSDSKMFRNFYVYIPGSGEFDAMSDGDSSCAFFVSSVLALFKKIDSMHGTVQNTLKDMEKSGWKKASQPKLGDVLVWESREFPNGSYEHIGFYIGDGRAVSASMYEKRIIEHGMYFGTEQREIKKILRMEKW